MTSTPIPASAAAPAAAPAVEATAVPEGTAAAEAALAARLARFVVKSGVGLGLLGDDDRALALAWAWAGLPPERVMNEREVNAVLAAQLQGPLCCLDTDHVELRRWLVDAGWLQRDGYGREYRRVSAGPARHGGLAASLAGLLAGTDTCGWAAARRQAHAAEREERRRRWQGQAERDGGS